MFAVNTAKALDEVIEDILMEGMTVPRKGRDMGWRGEGTALEFGMVRSTEAPENVMLSMECLLDVYYLYLHLPDGTVMRSTILFLMFRHTKIMPNSDHWSYLCLAGVA